MIAGSHAGGDAHRIHQLLRIQAQRRAHAGGGADRAEDRGRVEAGLVHQLRRHQAHPADHFGADRDAAARSEPLKPWRSAAASMAGTTTAPACAGPPS